MNALRCARLLSLLLVGEQEQNDEARANDAGPVKQAAQVGEVSVPQQGEADLAGAGTPSPASGPTKEEVRAALADARLKGLNISGLIAAVGASNLSGVDPARYPELLSRLADAIKVVG